MGDLENFTENISSENDNSKKATSNRVKRMRGWLGINSDFHTGGYAEDNDAPVYGDGHSGWNR